MLYLPCQITEPIVMNPFDIFRQPNRSIAFIDARVSLCQAGVIQLEPNTEIVFIDLERDGIEQITDILKARSNIQRIQIIGSANGQAANLQLGLAQLNIYTLDAYTKDLFQWRKALSANSEIILCGVGVISELMFHSFIQQLGKITGANIGAFVSFADTALNYPDTDSLMVAWQS